MKLLSRHKTFLLIAAVGLSYRLYFAWHDISLGILIADDAYYYFTIARNIVAGFGPTFDCFAPTNGFHPLWLLVLLPLFKLFGYSLWLPIKLALTLTSIFDLISGIIIYRIFDDKVYRTGGLIASAFWFLSAFTVFTGLRGMEASLAVMLALLLHSSIIKVFDSAARLALRSAIIPGLLFGLSCLARTDYSVLLGLPIIIFVIYKCVTQQSSRGIVWLFIMGGFSFAIVLPWIIWNYSVFGSIIQVSGASKLHFSSHFGVILTDGFTGGLRWIAYNIMAPIVIPAKFLAGEDFQSPRVSILIIFGALVITCIPFYLFSKSARRRLINKKLDSILFLSGMCIAIQFLLYGILFRTYATWYALIFYALLAILQGFAIPEIYRKFQYRKILTVVMISSLIAFNLALHPVFLIRSAASSIPPERYYGSVLREIIADYPDGVTIGAFNAGAIGYIAPQYGRLTVVDLDCLVNNKAFEAVRQGRYLNYITDNIDVLFEDPSLGSQLFTPDEFNSLCKIYIRDDGKSYWAKIRLNK